MKKLKRRKANSPPVEWKSNEEKLLLNYLKKHTFDSDALKKMLPGRSLASIRSKVRKLRIKHDLFGESYRVEKEDFTIEVAQAVNPKTVFDAYAGAGHQTFEWIKVAQTVYASEFMKSKLKQFDKLATKNSFEKINTGRNSWKHYQKEGKNIYLYIGDALDAAAEIKVNNVRIDLMDLDTCGSTLPLLPTLLVLTKPRHLVITHGEFHSMRFKREDVLRRLLTHRDISANPFPLEVDEMSAELDKAVKTAALRAHNETADSFWLELNDEVWLGSKFHGMLRRHYKVKKPAATSDCINELSIP